MTAAPRRPGRWLVAAVALGLGGAVAASVAPAVPTALGVTLLPTPDVLTVTHDRKAVVPAPGVLANDIGLGQGADAVLDDGPAHGSVNLHNDGGYTYEPDDGFVGSDQFTYHPTGLVGSGILGAGVVAIGTPVTITVIDTPPVGVADAYVATTGVELRVDHPGVLANDVDADGDSLTVSLLGGVAHGSLRLDPDGGMRYTSKSAYAGPDGFTYRIWDGAAWSLPVAVTIVVSGPIPTPTTKPSITPRPTPSPTPVPTATPAPTPTPVTNATPTPGASPGPTSSSSGQRSRATPRPSSGPVAVGAASGSGGGASGPGDDGPFHVAPPVVGPVDALSVGSTGLGDYEWAVPAIVLSVPGFLLILFVLAQAGIGLIWLPVARRRLGGLGSDLDERAGMRRSPPSRHS